MRLACFCSVVGCSSRSCTLCASATAVVEKGSASAMASFTIDGAPSMYVNNVTCKPASVGCAAQPLCCHSHIHIHSHRVE